MPALIPISLVWHGWTASNKSGNGPIEPCLFAVIDASRTICNHWLMFTEFLSTSDAQCVSLMLEKLSDYGLRGGALAGSLATEAHLLSQGRDTEPRPLNDLDFV